MNKTKIRCPQCEYVVEIDAVHSGGVILWRCCNCHHIIDTSEKDNLELALEKEEVNAITSTHR